MSRVYFHSPSGTAEVLGSERAWMGGFVEDIATGLLIIDDRLADLLPASHYLRGLSREDRMRWEKFYLTSWRVEGNTVEWNGQPVSGWDLSLNTVMAIGNDATRLLARLHAQCEIHAWVDGPQRAWFAELVEDGRAAGMLRAGAGWESVVDLLRSRDDEPVVTSYSVCDSFPNRWVSDWQPASDSDEDQDAWYDLPDEEQWRLSFASLERSGGGLRMRPADWSTMRFGHRLSVLDLLAEDYADRLNERFPAREAAGVSS